MVGAWLADVALAIWVAAWIWMGVTVAGDLRDLESLSHTLVRVGHATTQAGQTLGSFGDLPLLGDRVRGPAREITDAGRSAVASGRTTASSLHDASTLLGVAIALIPSIPLVALYLPRRVRWIRDRAALRRAQHAARRDPRFRAWLAQRASSQLPYHRALRATPPPWATDNTRDPGLADAELARYGLEREPRAR